jgi:hypothetical protein
VSKIDRKDTVSEFEEKEETTILVDKKSRRAEITL